MPLATIVYTTGQRKQTGDKTLALKAYNAKHGAMELTDKQRQYTALIKAVLLPPSWQAEVDNYQPVIQTHPDVRRMPRNGASHLNDPKEPQKPRTAHSGFIDAYKAKMNNLGVEQGKSQIMPRGDRD